MTTEEDYKKYTGGSLEKTLEFLSVLEKMGKEVWIRHVVVPEINDTDGDVLALREILKPYSCISKVELLPYKNLCKEKYKMLGMDFALGDTPAMSAKRISELAKILE